MLSSLPRPGTDVRPLRQWKTVSAAEACRTIGSGSTIGVGWLGDTLASALEDAFRDEQQPRDLTVVYATAIDAGRNHGLNLLAHEGLVRRVVGGQWHPVPRLQMLAAANRIEAYNLPVGVIHRLFRDIADGLPGHLSRSGLGTSADPRNSGGRLNRRTREQLVRLVATAGEDTLLYRGFPIDVAMVGVGFMAGTAAIVMSHQDMTMARAARRCGGIVIAQTNRIGTLEKLPADSVEVSDTLLDLLVTADSHDRAMETFVSMALPQSGALRLSQ